jgi:hypothetical protein
MPFHFEICPLKRYLAEIKPGCDFIQDNLAYRQEKQRAESDALREATIALQGTPAYKQAVAREDEVAMGK